MAAPRDLTVRNLTVTENIDSAGGIAGGGYLNWVDPDSGISWLAGTVDPRGQFAASCGSLYTRRIGGPFPGTSGELWLQVGPTADDWVRLYP